MKTKFRIFCILVLTSLILAACQGAAPAQTDETEQNIAVVRRFYEEFSNGNADVILEVHPATITMHYAGTAEEVETQLLYDDLAALKAANPDLRAEIHDIFGKGDIVVTELTWTTTHTGDYFGIPASGNTTLHPGIVVRRLEGGKIVESWEMWDDLAFMQSIGYLPSWDEIVANQSQPSAPTLITIHQLNPLVGIWRGHGGTPSDPPQTYWWFKPDGTYTVTFELEQFSDNFSVESGTFIVNGTQLILEATSNGCSGDPVTAKGTYEAELSFNGEGSPQALKLQAVSEECTNRKNALGLLPYVQAQP